MAFRVAVYTTNTWVSPLARLRFVGPIKQAGMSLIHGTEGDRIWPERAEQADVVVIQRDFPRNEQACRQVIQRARAAGKPIVFELDDLLFALPEHHPDRMQGYYAEALLPMLDVVIQADAVTVSTSPLADYLRPFNSRVFVLPNALDETIWTMRSPKAHRDGPLVIGYMGSPTHAPDLQMLLPVLLNLTQRYGEQIAFRFIGIEPPLALAEAAQVSWSPVRTLDYAQFASEFATEAVDIAISPLEDNAFNRAKSGIKFLEYTTLGIPGVYSALPPYTNIIINGQDGFLAAAPDVWEMHLSALIDDPDLRLRMAQAAQQTVVGRHLLAQSNHHWRDIYAQISLPAEGGQSALWLALQPIVAQIQGHFHTLVGRSEGEKARLAQQEVRRLRNQVQLLRSELEQIELERDSFGRQLWYIQNDPLWRRMQTLRRWKSRVLGRGAVAGTELSGNEMFPAVERTLQGEPTAEDGLTISGGILTGKPNPSQFDVFIFAVMDWDTRIQRPQQLARQFARTGHRVFYIRTDFHSGENTHVAFLEKNIWEVHFPASRQINLYRDVMDAALQAELETELEQVQAAFGVTVAVSLVDLPFWWPLVRALRASRGWPLVYDCMDYHRGFSTNETVMLAQEDALTRGSDLVLTTSHFLQRQMIELNPRCVLIPNGTDYEHFRFPPLGNPPEMRGVQEPVIGYYGAIADWFDTDLLRELALARPEWRFVLIGSTLYADLAPLEALPNVSLLGEKPYDVLPQYLHTFDVAIIPFKKTPLTEATNPVKLFEYLSAGKPVVATDLDELRHYADYVHLADTPETWLAALEIALEDTSLMRIQARQEFARQNTWAARFAQAEAAMLTPFPKVSVIVLTYNNLDYTRLCLRSILEKTQYPNYEIVVVDNASSDDTPAYLHALAEREPRIKVHLNAENVGFAAGNNQGAQLASGEMLIFLNNDTVVPSGWMSGLVRHIQDLAVGMVGPVTNWSGNETLIDVPYLTIGEMDAFAAEYTTARRGQTFEIAMLPFLCVALRRKVFDEIGPLDEQFGVGMFEDDDYARRMRAKNYLIICAEDVFVHHWGSASFSRLKDETYRRIFEENRHKLETKWGIKWMPHEDRFS